MSNFRLFFHVIAGLKISITQLEEFLTNCRFLFAVPGFIMIREGVATDDPGDI